MNKGAIIGVVVVLIIIIAGVGYYLSSAKSVTTIPSTLAPTSTISSISTSGNASYISQPQARAVLGLNGTYQASYTNNLITAAKFYPAISSMTKNISHAWFMKYTDTTGCTNLTSRIATGPNTTPKLCYTFGVGTYNTKDSKSIYNNLTNITRPSYSTRNATANGITYSVVSKAIGSNTLLNIYALKGNDVVISWLSTNQTVNQSLVVSSILATLK
jgi:hypothetical protein